MYNRLGIFVQEVRPQISSLSKGDCYVFVAGTDGKQLHSSRVMEQFNTMWNKAVGSKQRPRTSGSLVRKSFTTTVH